MAKFVVYEIWTTARVIEATDEDDAMAKGEPKGAPANMDLCNWHVVPMGGEVIRLAKSGGTDER